MTDPGAIFEKHAYELEEGANTDWFFYTIATLVEEVGLEIGMTIQTGAILISGTLISESRYFDEVAKQIAEKATGQQEIASALTNLCKIANQAVRDNRASRVEAGLKGVQPSYFQFKNAKFFSAGTQLSAPGEQGILWRCKRRDVSGFLIGELNQP